MRVSETRGEKQFSEGIFKGAQALGLGGGIESIERGKAWRSR